MTKRTQGSAAASSSGEAAAAVSEGEGREFEWEGLTLKALPESEIPRSYKFELIDYQDSPSSYMLLRLLRMRLDQDSYEQLRSFWDQAEFDDDKAEFEAINDLMKLAAGVDAGE